jgi:hypothetical protein
MMRSREAVEIAKTIRSAAAELHKNGPHDGVSIIAAADLWKISNEILSSDTKVVADNGACDADRMRQASLN